MKKVYYSLMFMLIFVLGAQAQERGTITGKVIDSRTKEPLIGVNVIIVDSNRGTTTDLDGNYTIANVPVGTYRLRFTYIGYEILFKTDIVVKTVRPAQVNVEMTESVIEGEEVTVTAGYFVEEEKIQPSTIGLSREEIRRYPGGFEDVVRTVSTLPGVSINASGGRNDLLVRGGGPSENLYIINNIEVPNINHFGSQGNSSGSLSFVNLDFVDDVTFSTGGFSARYGDKMSSVLSLTMSQGSTEDLDFKGIVSATQYGFNFDGPIGRQGNFIFSARQSYLDLIFKAAGLPFVPVYTDFNVIANYDLSPKDRLFVLGLGAINRVNRDQSSFENRITNATLLDNTQNQWIGGLDYRRLLGNGYLDLTFNANLFQYRFNQVDENEKEYFNSKADENEISLKAQRYWILAKTLGVKAGLSTRSVLNQNTTTFADTIYDRSGNRIPAAILGVDPSTTVNARAQKSAGFVEMDWLVQPQLNINLGVRADYYGFIDQSLYLAPRLALKYKLTERHSLRFSSGIYYQSPSYVWVINPDNKKLRALQNQMGVLGWDFLLRNDFRMSVEGFYKRYLDLPSGIVPGRTDYIVLTNTGTGFGGREDDFQSFGYYSLTSTAKGNAYGLELLLQKKFSEVPCYGQVSLSYAKSRFTANNGQTYPGQYDQRFIFNISGGYIFNSKWQMSSKFRYFTGVPYSPVYRPGENPTGRTTLENLPDEYLSARLDAGHHLDLRVDRFFNFRNQTLIVYLDIQNIYNYKIPTRPRYDFVDNSISTSNSIGILPSIGISYEF